MARGGGVYQIGINMMEKQCVNCGKGILTDIYLDNYLTHFYIVYI